MVVGLGAGVVGVAAVVGVEEASAPGDADAAPPVDLGESSQPAARPATQSRRIEARDMAAQCRPKPPRADKSELETGLEVLAGRGSEREGVDRGALVAQAEPALAGVVAGALGAVHERVLADVGGGIAAEPGRAGDRVRAG